MINETITALREQLAKVEGERERARSVAVKLEQELASLQTTLSDLDGQVRNEIAEEIHKGFRQFSFICEDGKCQHDDCCAVRSDPFNQVREYLLRDIIRAVKGY